MSDTANDTLWDGTGPDPAATAAPDQLETWEAEGHAVKLERPTIRVRAGGLDEQVIAALAALSAADKNLFQRNGGLVTIVREPSRTEGGQICEGRAALADACTSCGSGKGEACSRMKRHGSDILTRPGTPKLIKMSAAGLTRRASRFTRWERFDSRRGKGNAGERGGEWVESDPCERTLTLMASPEEGYPGIRPIRGLLETPCLGPSGRVIQRPGYDEETRYVLLPSVDVGRDIDLPTQENARNALRFLWTEIACDFPFRGLGEVDQATDPERSLQFSKAVEIPDAFVGVAMLLTIFARPAISGGIPAAVFEAAGQGSGKSLQMHTIAMVATSRAASVATFPMKDGRADEAELEKILAGYALSGTRIISFDNIRGLLGGATMEKAISAVETIDLRVLGSNDQRTLEWVAAMLFSGNNMTMVDDIAQRCMVSRVESPREDPRSRPAASFRHPYLLAAIKQRRAKLVRAVLVILRAYVAAKTNGASVEDPGVRGSFESWSAIVPGALMYAGGPNILRAFPEGGRGGDDEGEAHATLLRLWRDEWQNRKASVILDGLFPEDERDQAHGKAPPDGLDDARAAVRVLLKTRDGVKPGAHALGMRLRQLRGKIRDGLKIDVDIDRSSKVSTYRVVRVTA